jgi:hypothetical protein
VISLLRNIRSRDRADAAEAWQKCGQPMLDSINLVEKIPPIHFQLAATQFPICPYEKMVFE